MHTVEELEHDGLKIQIYVDPDQASSDPRDCDNFGRIVCWHRRYNLGDTDKSASGKRYASHSDGTVFADPDNFEQWWNEQPKGGMRFPVSLLDHSGISMYIGSGAHPCDPGGWDSGQVGWVYATADMIRNEYSCKRITLAIREKAIALLKCEVEAYDCFIRGEVYGYIVKEDGETVDSCWGFVGDVKYCTEEAMAAAKAFAKSREGSDALMRL